MAMVIKSSYMYRIQCLSITTLHVFMIALPIPG